jgi:hypothetical protein
MFFTHTQHWLMLAPKGTKSLSELKVLARLRGHQIFGGIDDCEVWGHWDFSLPFLCFAIPKWLIQSTQENHADLTMPAYSALDVVLSNPRTVLPYDGWCCLNLPKQVTMIFMKNGVWDSLRSLTTPSEIASLDWICAELNRESLRRLSSLDMDNLLAPFGHQVLWYDWTTAKRPHRSSVPIPNKISQ